MLKILQNQILVDNEMSYYIKLKIKKLLISLCYNIQVMKIVMLYYFILNIKNDYFFKKYNST